MSFDPELKQAALRLKKRLLKSDLISEIKIADPTYGTHLKIKDKQSTYIFPLNDNSTSLQRRGD